MDCGGTSVHQCEVLSHTRWQIEDGEETTDKSKVSTCYLSGPYCWSHDLLVPKAGLKRTLVHWRASETES